jgi:hypothetical protein
MGKQTLFAYVNGRDHDEKLVAAVGSRLDALVANRTWVSKDVWVVNQREPPDWDLGLNLALAPLRSRPARWTDDVVAIATELGVLHRETGRDFVIGIHDASSDRTIDIFVVDTDEPDHERLRRALTAK